MTYITPRPTYYDIVAKTFVVDLSCGRIEIAVDEHGNLTVFECDDLGQWNEASEEEGIYHVACAIDYLEDINEIGTEEDVRRIADFYRWNGNEFDSWEVVKNICCIKDAYNSWPLSYDEAKAKFKIWKRAKDIASVHREGAD